MRRVRPAVWNSDDGERWVNFGELAEIVAKGHARSPKEIWEVLRQQEFSRGGLMYTTAGLIRFNAEERSPESIHTDLRFVFIEERVGDIVL